MEANMSRIINIKKPGFDEAILKKMILEGLAKAEDKEIPNLMLYDETGLQLFKEITFLEEYYIARAELDAMQSHIAEIVDCIPDNSMIVELGAGPPRKTKLLLDAVEQRRRNVTYFALDLKEKELEKSLEAIGTYQNISTHGLCGTYEDAISHLATFPQSQPKFLVWMGSSISNLSRAEAVEFLRKVAKNLNPGDKFLIGMDLPSDKEKLVRSYNDEKGVIRAFVWNGMAHCNRLFGKDLFDMANFELQSTTEPNSGCHEWAYKCLNTHTIESQDPKATLLIEEGDSISILRSFKYSANEIHSFFKDSGLLLKQQWLDSTSSVSVNIVQVPKPASNISAFYELSKVQGQVLSTI